MVLIIEDDEILNRGIQHCLNSEGIETHGGFSMAQALTMVKDNVYDLIILDVQLPDGCGFTLIESLLEIVPGVPVVFLTARDMEKDVLKGYDLGADDYITKPFNINILKKKITAILRRTNKIPNDCYRLKDLNVVFSKHEVFKGSEKLMLTPTEYRLLEYFIQMKNKVITKDMFIDYLYDQEASYIDEHALAVYISRLRHKIEDPTSKFIKTIYGMGYTWIEE